MQSLALARVVLLAVGLWLTHGALSQAVLANATAVSTSDLPARAAQGQANVDAHDDEAVEATEGRDRDEAGRSASLVAAAPEVCARRVPRQCTYPSEFSPALCDAHRTRGPPCASVLR